MFTQRKNLINRVYTKANQTDGIHKPRLVCDSFTIDILQKESELNKHSGYYQKIYSKLKHSFEKRTFSL